MHGYRLIKDKLQGVLGAPIFLDSDDLKDLRSLQHQVAMSDVLLLFQTHSVLERPWCLVEIFTALTHSVPVVPIHLSGVAAQYDFAAAQMFLDNFEVELERRSPGASNVIRGAGIDVPLLTILYPPPYVIKQKSTGTYILVAQH